MQKKKKAGFSEYKREVKKSRINFAEIQTTGEYMEMQYFSQKMTPDDAYSRVSYSWFFCDYAQHILESSSKPFLSANFFDSCSHETGAILIFALLDLPLRPSEDDHQMKMQDRALEITAGTNAIIFTKEVKEAPIELSSDILVTHRYVAVSDRDLEQERSIPDEFLVNKAY